MRPRREHFDGLEPKRRDLEQMVARQSLVVVEVRRYPELTLFHRLNTPFYIWSNSGEASPSGARRCGPPATVAAGRNGGTSPASRGRSSKCAGCIECRPGSGE